MVMASSRNGSTLLLLMSAAVLLLVFAAYSSTARPDPAFPIISSSSQVVEERQTESNAVGMEERCKEDELEDECLMRRTLVAHIDYIYTQNHKH